MNFTDEEREALGSLLPRVVVANIATLGSPLASALYKLDPKLLPWEIRRQMNGAAAPGGLEPPTPAFSGPRSTN